MIITLDDTTSQGINNALVQAQRTGGVTSGMVFTMIVVADTWEFDRVLSACVDAGREHPSRIIVVAAGQMPATRLDATIRRGEGVPGEVITLRFHGELIAHQARVLLPLLLPDSPVIVWWPGSSPASPGDDPIGRLGSRRITDAMGVSDPIAALRVRAENYQRGDTDLTWTRLTRWRALLAAALDQYPAKVKGVKLAGSPNNAPTTLLAAWLESRLHVPVIRTDSAGPGITEVRLSTESGEIAITRTDGTLASFTAPGLPHRTVALRRRDINALLTEELRRMDPDETYEVVLATLGERYRREDEHSEEGR